MIKIKNIPTHKRPREKLIEKGVQALNDYELLAILLQTGIKNKSVIQISKTILQRFPKKAMLSLTHNQLASVKGVGTARACIVVASFELSKRLLEIKESNLPVIVTSEDAVAQLQNICSADKEYCVALYLNARNHLICKEIISIGTIDASLVHPREVFKIGISCLASKIIIAHNHPSGVTEPSDEDMEITRKLVYSGKILDIDIIDHIIVTETAWSSMKPLILEM